MSTTAEEIIQFYQQLRIEIIQKWLEMEQLLAKTNKILAEQRAKTNGS
jgi:phage regulator Rha-like protein